MNTTLRLALLGTPVVTLGERELTGFITVKSRALLYYLAMRTGIHGRHTLATLLWPEAPEANAAKNLRDVLSNLRQLAGDHLDITRETASFRRESDYALDVEAFSSSVERFRRGWKDIGDLESAVSLYRGDFLEGFLVPDSADYELWLTVEREQLRQAQLAALYALAAWHAQYSDVKTSMGFATQLLALDSLSEPGQQLKMGLLTLAGQRNEALAQYDVFRDQLHQELGASPLPETTDLYQQIRSGQFGAEQWIAAIGQAPLTYFQPPAHAKGPDRDGTRPLSGVGSRLDLSDVPVPGQFLGRREQLEHLHQWLNNGDARVIAVTGMGGVGKTSLVARLIQRLASAPGAGRAISATVKPAGRFEAVVWRSLINAPSLTDLIRDVLGVVDDGDMTEGPDGLDRQLAQLRTLLRKRRLLLVLDNFETVLSEGSRAGEYRPELGAFRRLMELFAQSEHTSCLIITTRELPNELARMSHDNLQVRQLALAGLPDTTGIDLLRARGLEGEDEALGEIVHRYSGNPLALKLVADTAKSLFGGAVDTILEEPAVFGDIRGVLDEQFNRLTANEAEIIYWLAIGREPATSSELWRDLATRPQKRQFIDALRSLFLRSLLEQVTRLGETTQQTISLYSLQNVVMEYATSHLIETVCSEIESGRIDALQRHGLVMATAPEFVQASQHRLVLKPVVEWMVGRFGRDGAIQRLRHLLALLRAEPARSVGYFGANLLHLLVALGEDLKGYDFSNVTVRNADLRSVPLRGVSFRGADLSTSVFRNTFDIVLAVGFTADGESLVARATDGSISEWRLHDYQPLRTIARYTGYDFGLALSPDGQTLATGGPGTTVRLLDLVSGQERAALRGHTAQIIDLRFSRDGSRLYSSSLDGSICFWDPTEQRLLRRVDLAGNACFALAPSRDGAVLAAGLMDGSITLLDTLEGGVVGRLPAQSNKKIRALAYSPDGTTLAAAGEDNTIQLWTPTGERAGVLSGHTDAVLALAFHPDGGILASGSADKSIRLWDWSHQRLVRVLPPSANWVTTVAYSPDGSLLASGSYDRSIRLWQARTGHLIHMLQGSSRFVNQIAFSPDGRYLASATFDQPVRVWDTQRGNLLYDLKGHRGSIRRLVFGPNSQWLATSGDGQMIRLWELETGQLMKTFGQGESHIRTMAFSPDGSLLAAGFGMNAGSLTLWDVASGQVRLAIEDARVGLDISFGFSPDGRFLAYSDRDCTIRLLGLADGDSRCEVRHHTVPIETLSFSPDGAHLASQDKSGRLCVWRLNDDGTVCLQAETPPVEENKGLWNLAFSPDGNAVAFQMTEQKLAVLEIASGGIRCLIEQSLHSEGAMAFTVDGTCLVTVGSDGNIRQWDTTSGECVQTFTGGAGAVGRFSVHAPSERVAGSSNDGAIRIWDILSGHCQQVMRAPGPYEDMDITGALGLSTAQVDNLELLGAATHRD